MLWVAEPGQDSCRGVVEGVGSCVMEKPAETTTPAEEKHSIPWTGFIVWPFVILILYVLSIGPVAIMSDKGLISHNNEFIWKFYKPLGWAYLNTPLHRPLGMYLHLWVPKHFDKHGDGGI